MIEDPHLYRKATPPAKGAAFDHHWLQEYSGVPGAPALIFDLSRLTLADYSEMRTHPQVNASLSLMGFMLHQCDWRIECSNQKIADAIEENMRQIWTPLIRAIMTAYWAGYSPSVLEWDDSPDGKYLFIDKVKDLHPGTCSINWKEVESSYVPRPGDVPNPRSQTKRKVRVYDGIKVNGLEYPVPPEHCVHPDTPILCADLTWRRAGDLVVGDEIVAFDENPGANGRRHYRTGTVEFAHRIRKHSMRVSIQGREPIIATTDHPWLVYRELPRQRAVRSDSAGKSKRPREMAWVKTNELKPGDILCHFADPWTENTSRDAGWLAGMFDGEGCLSGPSNGFYSLSVSQKPGPVLDRMKEILAADQFDFEIRQSTGSFATKNECYTVWIKGGRREIMRFLGTYRPERWQERYKELYEGTWLRFNGDTASASRGGSVGLVEVTGVEDVGVQDITSLQTSTATYIGGGFLMHNTFWYPMLREHGDWYGRKLLKPAFAPWYFSLLIHLFANRYFERFGEPMPIGRAPFGETFNYTDDSGVEVEVTGKQLVEQALQRLRSTGRVVLPSDRDTRSSVRSDYLYDIEYLESQMRGADFERYMARLDEEISLAIFMPMLLVRSGDRGSLALGVQHTQTWLFSLNALAQDLKEYIDKYICERIKMYNFSQKAPKVEWVVRPMGKDNSETLRAIITTLVRKGAAKVDLDDLGVALGMRLEEVEQLIGVDQPMLPGVGGDGGQWDDRTREDRTDRIRDTPDRVTDRNTG